VPPSAPDRAFRIEPYAYSEARALSRGLGVSDPVAITLVRRGYRTLEAARDFLDASESHDPFEFESMENVSELVLEAVRARRTITVHGDYDVDGVCSTAILVRALRELGARCDWFIPDRLGDGYGLTEAGVKRLAARGTELIVTVDCGITAAREVAAARGAGVEVIVTDHHIPNERLPDCPIVHPRISGYPCPDLCATGVAYKLSEALRERGGIGATAADEDLDLVALATVADLVPLTGENRALVRRGLVEARKASRPGLRALIAAAGGEPSRLDEGDLAFRLAPRINAAGRLYRADGGVELMLCEDEERAAQIASELDRANRERRGAEQETLVRAEAALAELPGGAEAQALVVAGEGWHPGVVGIVASRLCERHCRPVILIALDSPHPGRGSGRSIPGFDLLAALRACGEHLIRFGGHRAAAGLEIEPARVDAFREAFVARAARSLSPSDLIPTETVDAIVGSDRLGLDTAEELQRLAPFGVGNPGVRLLVPAGRVLGVRPMGGGKHARFSVASGSARALGVAFGSTDRSLASHDGAPIDLSVRLEVNQWNGAVEPRVVLKEVYPIAETDEPGPNGTHSPEREADGHAGCPHSAAAGEWWSRASAERDARLREWPPRVLVEAIEAAGASRESIERAGGSGIAALADLVSSGAPVLALCAHASRRGALAQRADPRRFGYGAPVHACGRCASESLDARLRELLGAGSGLVLADWAALGRNPGLPRRFEHVVLIDPPPFAHLEALVARGRGFLHPTWGAEELAFALRAHDAEWEPRSGPSRLYRGLCAHGGEATGRQLIGILAGEGVHPRTPEEAGRCVRVLEELGLVAWAAGGSDRALRVVSSEQTDLERSKAYLAYRARHEEGRRFLTSKQRARAA
jgi:single-stranded-DNA-specific exonuclease